MSNFSTPELVQKSEQFLNSVEKPACPNCTYGIRMCHHTPCMGTVDDIERLIDAGYAKNLMIDWWMGGRTADKAAETLTTSPSKKKVLTGENNPFDHDITYLVPAVIGYEGKKCSLGRTGTCNLLVNNQCSLHDKGLKPIQGQFACCKVERVFINDQGEETELDERISILHTWNTQRGKDLVERWKKEVNFEGTDTIDLPKSPIEMIGTLVEVMLSHSRTEERLKEHNVPEPTEEDINRKKTTVTYEKPY